MYKNVHKLDLQSGCLAGNKCQNQRFVKRQYPKLEKISCGEKWFGLRTSSNTLIKKGDFIYEYVGEIIDNEELNIWMENLTQKGITSFYFMTLDKNRSVNYYYG